MIVFLFGVCNSIKDVLNWVTWPRRKFKTIDVLWVALLMSFYTNWLCLESYILLFSFSIAMDGNNFINLEHPKSFFLSSEKAYNRFLLIFLYSLTTLGAISIVPMSNPFKERVCSFHCTYMDFYTLAFLKFKNNLIIITNAKCGLLIKITCHWLKEYLR